MRFIIFAILLAFPFLEIAVLIELSQRYGWWVLAYLLIIGFLGLQLIRAEKNLIAARMFQQLASGGNPITAMFSTARNMFAGVLLLIPGVISDLIAVVLLFMPVNKTSSGNASSNKTESHYQASANDEVIEGEYTKINEAKPKDNVVHLPKKD
ncbi:MAG TPA: FxsA family protein [Methylophilus sp.]|uniref:FxsA family protein n=1 Tax=Methylophilus sp. TaxID=29541 RepID=UPI002C6B6D8D|nr:FxsA family protein [Methylophilus sp.]HSH86048.1 FxsA family protein [Methylophilus sp.]